jgi:hypothetical protein
MKSALLAFAFLATAAAAAPVQVVILHDGADARIARVAPIAPMAKAIRSPGVTGAAGLVRFDAEWLAADGSVLARSRTELPVGTRAPMAEDAAGGGFCAIAHPESGGATLRLDGPPEGRAAASLRLRRTGAERLAIAPVNIPEAFRADTITLPLPPGAARTLEGPVAAVKVRDTGADGNRFVLVIVGEGYTQANLDAGRFANDTAALLDSFEDKEPWGVYFAGTNVYRLDTVSNEEGADRTTDQSGPFVDTYYNATFWGGGIERLLVLDSTGYARATQAADSLVGVGVWDQLLVLVNSTKYGGAGGSICTSSVHVSADEIVIHELGHSFAGLADEYTTPYPGYPPGDSEPNVDYDGQGEGLKWLPWVESGTPLPTPDTPTYSTTVGAFEGARYLATGIYRPWRNCLMKILGPQFCPVCREAHISAFFGIVRPVDRATPEPGVAVRISAPQAFSIVPVPTGQWACEWRIGGTLLAETGPELVLAPQDVPGDAATLEVTVRHVTDWMRLGEVSQTLAWPLTAASLQEQWSLF